jgi:hypothetical protein
MDERRKGSRDKVLLGGVASHDAAPDKDCIVRDLSDSGARLEFKGLARLPKDELTLKIARKGRSFMAKVVWWRDNIIGVAFSDKPLDTAPPSDLEERLRKSEKKKRELQRKINNLLGQ